MMLREILRVKGSDVFWTLPSASISDLVRLLVEHNCGSLVVLADGDRRRMVGIVTERDVLRACAAGKPLEQTRVEAVMTSPVVTGHVDDSIEQTMGVMTDKRIRHLPLVEKDELVGIISIGDVVKAHRDHLTAENLHLKTYIRS